MWNLLARYGLTLRTDIEDKENIALTTAVKNTLQGKTDFDETEMFLIKIAEKHGLHIEKNENFQPLPEELMAFALKSVNSILTTLKTNTIEVAYDISDILQALPDLSYLSDKNNVKDFNKSYIIPLAEKWDNLNLVPKLSVIGQSVK